MLENHDWCSGPLEFLSGLIHRKTLNFSGGLRYGKIGTVPTSECSGGISADLFHKIVASAGTDAGVDAFISERMGGAPDHPMTVAS